MEKIIELIKWIIDRSGMRAFITMLVDAGLLYLIYIDKVDSTIATIGIIILTIVFYFVRHYERKDRNEN